MNLISKFYDAATLRLQQKPNHQFLAEILEERPELKGEDFYFPPQGTLSYTIVIGDEVFKKPTSKNNPLGPIFNKDRKNLQNFGHTNLKILPKITYMGKDNDFYAMTKIPGIILKKKLDKLTEKEQEVLAEDIAKAIIAIAEELPMKKGKFARHGDLKPENILIDPKTNRLTGIIDFGRIGYCSQEKLGTLPILYKWHYGDSKMRDMIRNKYKEITSKPFKKTQRQVPPTLRTSSA